MGDQFYRSEQIMVKYSNAKRNQQSWLDQGFELMMKACGLDSSTKAEIWYAKGKIVVFAFEIGASFEQHKKGRSSIDKEVQEHYVKQVRLCY